MSSSTLSSPSHMRACWIAWIVIVGFVLLLRFTVPHHFSYLAVTYAVCTWLPIMVLHYIDGRRLVSHLKMHHHQHWEYLTWAFGAPGGRNSFRMLPWLFSTEDYGDATLARLKSAHRQLLLFTLVVFLSYLILTPILDA